MASFTARLTFQYGTPVNEIDAPHLFDNGEVDEDVLNMMRDRIDDLIRRLNEHDGDWRLALRDAIDANCADYGLDINDHAQEITIRYGWLPDELGC